jgi:hypothetical protein
LGSRSGDFGVFKKGSVVRNFCKFCSSEEYWSSTADVVIFEEGVWLLIFSMYSFKNSFFRFSVLVGVTMN